MSIHNFNKNMIRKFGNSLHVVGSRYVVVQNQRFLKALKVNFCRSIQKDAPYKNAACTIFTEKLRTKKWVYCWRIWILDLAQTNAEVLWPQIYAAKRVWGLEDAVFGLWEALPDENLLIKLTISGRRRRDTTTRKAQQMIQTSFLKIRLLSLALCYRFKNV